MPVPRPLPRFAALLLAATAVATLAAPRCATAAAASTTGRIAIRLVGPDHEAVAYANVTLPDLKRGGTTDEGGRLVLTAVPPGRYTVEAGLMGLGRKTAIVDVRAGGTSEIVITFTREEVAAELPEFVVTADQLIDTRGTDTKKRFSGDHLLAMPVDDVAEAVATGAGVVAQGGALHVRGGRGNEVKTSINGMEVSNALVGSAASISPVAVAEAEVVTGGFDAEHGRALSGLINLTTREGKKDFGGMVRWDTDRYGDPTKTFDHYDRVTTGVGGPTPVRNLTWFATYEGTFSDTYLRSTMTRPSRTFLDFIRLGNRQSNQINTSFKLAWRPDSANKLTFETLNNRSLITPYNHMWSRKGYVHLTYDTLRAAGQPDTYVPRYGAWSATRLDDHDVPMNLPDHVPTLDDRFQQWSGTWTRQIDTTGVFSLRATAFTFDTHNGVGGKEPWEYDTQSPNYWSGNTDLNSENNLFFATHGDFPFYTQRRASTWAVKSDLATQRWPHHRMKTGVDLRYNRVSNLSLVLPNSETSGLPGAVRSDYANFNPEGAAYVQDRWEFEGLVLNAGLRYDMFTPGPQIDDDELPSGTRYKQQFSPRLGIAYPISDKDVLSFHYGWTYQSPTGNLVFENREVNSTVAIRGNPDLDPETNIAYQAAVQHLFSRDVSGQFAVFFKDIYGLITTRQTIDEFGNQVPFFVNGDYASSRGFEASLTKSFSHKFSAEVNYTFSLATGVASNPNEALQFFNGGQLYLPISEQPLDWDQRHSVSVLGTFRDEGKWGLRMLWQFGSGFPFTPVYRNDRRPDPVLKNSRRLPSDATLTLDGDKFFRIWGQNVTVFFDARNVLDAKNIQALSQGVFPNPFIGNSGDEYTIYYTETGRAGGAYLQDRNGDGILDWVPVNDPRVFAEGRQVRMGVSMMF